MKKTYRLLLLILICLLTGGCKKDKNPVKEEKAYLSISVTYDNNGVNSSNGMTTKVIAYDIQTDNVQLIDEVEYTSQYPLTVYDANTQTIFYSADDNKKKDQLYSKSLTTGKIEKLTDSLFAINNIIPTDKFVVLNAVAHDETILKPYIINRSTGEVTKVEIYKDFSVNHINLNPLTKRLFVGGFLSSEDYGRVMEFNDFLNESKLEIEEAPFTLADGYLFELTENYQVPNLLLKTQQQGVEKGIPSDDNGNVYVELSSNGVMARLRPITESKIYNQQTKKLEDADTLDGLNLYASYYTIYNNEAYILGSALKEEEYSIYPRAIYRYNLTDKTLTKIFQVDDFSFINNFVLLTTTEEFITKEQADSTNLTPTRATDVSDDSGDIAEITGGASESDNLEIDVENLEVDITYNQPDENGIVVADELPRRAEPGSEIYFIEDNKYKFISGGPYLYTEEELKEEILSIQRSRKEAKEKGWTYEEMEKPEKGMRITYAGDGYIARIYRDK